jgi:hypothetical protein
MMLMISNVWRQAHRRCLTSPSTPSPRLALGLTALQRGRPAVACVGTRASALDRPVTLGEQTGLLDPVSP